MMKTIGGSLPLANKFIVIGSIGDRRLQLFAAALQRLGLPPAQQVSYQNVLTGKENLADIVSAGDVVRIESPGKSWLTEKLLLQVGAEAAQREAGYEALAHSEVTQLTFDKGRITYPHQWYLGFCATLDLIAHQLTQAPPHLSMNRTSAIKTMFDKRLVHKQLTAVNLPVPQSLNPITSYDDLWQAIQKTGIKRLFIKAAHGSSASGVVAYETNGRQHKATTTVEMVQNGAEVRLYNSRRIRTYRDQREIALLIDHLCQQHVHVEQWIPKASVNGRFCDIRIVVIGNQARHSIIRLSQSPMTNLHLLNERASIDILPNKVGDAVWQQVQQQCEQAVGLFPDTLYAGVDLLFTPNWKNAYILELNAFGDLLPTVRDNGVDTYEAEIEATLAQLQSILD